MAQSAQPLIDQGDAKLETEDYQAAVDLYLQAIKLQEEQDSSSAILECYYSIGYAYLQMGKMNEFAQFEPQIIPYLDLADTYLADVEVALGSSHRHLDKLQKALFYYQAAIEDSPLDDPDYHPTLSAAYNNSGIIYRRLGDTERARLHYQKALGYYQNSPLNYARTLGNIGQLYRSEGQLALAQASFEQALDTLQAYPHRGMHTRVIIADDLAMLLDEQGDYQQALVFLQQAERWLEQGHSFESNLLRHYGQVFRHLDKLGLAERFVSQSMALREAQYPHRHYSRAALHQDQAILDRQKQAYEASLKQIQQSFYHLSGVFKSKSLTDLPKLERISYPQEMLKSLESKASTWEAWYSQSQTPQHLIEAHHTYQLATQLADSMRLSYWGEEAKLLLSQSILPLYEKAIANALVLHQLTQDSKWLFEAYYFAAKNKAAILREQLRQEHASSGAGIPDSLIIRERELRYRLAQSEQDLSLYPDSVELQDQRFALYQAQLKAQERIEANYPQYLQLKQEAVFTDPKAILDRLGAGELLVEYFWADEIVHIFALYQGKLQYKAINEKGDLEEELLNFIASLRDPQMAERANAQDLAQYQARASHLYEQLLGDLLPTTALQQIMIIADGPLGFLPFASLCRTSDPKTSFAQLPYLLHQAPIRYLYAVHTLWDEALPRAPENFGGFAPNFSGPISDERSAQPGKLENQAVAKLMAEKWQGDAFVEEAASRQRFMQEAKRYQVIHLATHAYTDEAEASRSALWLNGDTSESARVFAYEIYHLPLQARLAVLSACETGTGKLQAGEGIYSLARAFRAAGCGTTVMSLWQVNDQATQDLMEAFYAALDQGAQPSLALQEAKQDYLEQHDLAHPYYWSAFVVIGQDSQLDLQERNIGWWIAGGIIVLLLFGIFVRKKLPLSV
ncbi:MAG: CHAT domain-containing tetratricopeptide repeat protein [Bacteroidota bacterium]